MAVPLGSPLAGRKETVTLPGVNKNSSVPVTVFDIVAFTTTGNGPTKTEPSLTVMLPFSLYRLTSTLRTPDSFAKNEASRLAPGANIWRYPDATV